MTIYLKIHYQAPAHEHPVPLSVALILDSICFLKVDPARDVQVARVTQHYAVKYGRDVDLTEGENLLFVQRKTASWQMRTPRVYTMFEDLQTGRKFLVMEYIHGQRLCDVWDGFDKRRKEFIADKLFRDFVNLRSLPAPALHFGSVNGKGPLDPVFHVANQQQSDTLITEDQFTSALIQAVPKPHLYQTVNGEARVLIHPLKAVLKGYRPVFTHGKLYPWNTIIREEDGMPVVMNWSRAGWYPEYWEYCTAIAPEWNYALLGANWVTYLTRRILQQYFKESFSLSMYFRVDDKSGACSLADIAGKESSEEDVEDDEDDEDDEDQGEDLSTTSDS